MAGAQRPQLLCTSTHTSLPARCPPQPRPVPGTVPGSASARAGRDRTADASATVRTGWATTYLAPRRSRWPGRNKPSIWAETWRGTDGIASRPTHARPARDVAAFPERMPVKAEPANRSMRGGPRSASARWRTNGRWRASATASDAPTTGCGRPRCGCSDDCAAGTRAPREVT